jgi:hypothetical protein
MFLLLVILRDSVSIFMSQTRCEKIKKKKKYKFVACDTRFKN